MGQVANVRYDFVVLLGRSGDDSHANGLPEFLKLRNLSVAVTI